MQTLSMLLLFFQDLLLLTHERTAALRVLLLCCGCWWSVFNRSISFRQHVRLPYQYLQNVIVAALQSLFCCASFHCYAMILPWLSAIQLVVELHFIWCDSTFCVPTTCLKPIEEKERKKDKNLHKQSLNSPQFSIYIKPFKLNSFILIRRCCIFETHMHAFKWKPIKKR